MPGQQSVSAIFIGLVLFHSERLRDLRWPEFDQWTRCHTWGYGRACQSAPTRQGAENQQTPTDDPCRLNMIVLFSNTCLTALPREQIGRAFVKTRLIFSGVMTQHTVMMVMSDWMTRLWLCLDGCDRICNREKPYAGQFRSSLFKSSTTPLSTKQQIGATYETATMPNNRLAVPPALLRSKRDRLQLKRETDTILRSGTAM
ncbi:predicted protein [Plenodomus lingam JN3]|uniref:Predicted protein n=1 Tax=Leptosphaeria maculans (strain JN3 / isolate v23.1.3 / race Av1-4-5-6-7-8) TaxID=985895 RepID=E4ZNP8_LEPMJ|nr:predicted protein [Plenodomus lingam JN3]CBX93267.1 predicted protein [Plenodomus lingam JN3]